MLQYLKFSYETEKNDFLCKTFTLHNDNRNKTRTEIGTGHGVIAVINVAPSDP